MQGEVMKNQGTASTNMGGRSEKVKNDHPQELEKEQPLLPLQEQGGDDKKRKHPPAMAHAGDQCHGCELFASAQGKCLLNSRLARVAPCSLWDAGVPYCMACQIAWTDVPVARVEAIRRSAYQNITLANGAQLVARHLRLEAYPRPAYGWGVRNTTERTLLLFSADCNVTLLEDQFNMQFNMQSSSAHFVYLSNKKTFLPMAAEGAANKLPGTLFSEEAVKAQDVPDIPNASDPQRVQIHFHPNQTQPRDGQTPFYFDQGTNPFGLPPAQNPPFSEEFSDLMIEEQDAELKRALDWLQ